MPHQPSSVRREPVRLASPDPMAPAVHRFGERPTVARMVRRRLFPERRVLADDQLVWPPFRKIRRAS
ncbi:MAG: hypothetical protein E6I65_07920 [Chloroflexi bacterium]|nr:MAG: hypothetical protein E6I65_07920 [Chloroflexota bacterium]